MKKTSFSVLISIYQKESPEYLQACFDSLITQTVQADEIVVVFDGEVTKALQDVVTLYSASLPIVKIGYSVNRGLGYALHFGLLQCKFDLVARMDADDICEPKRFESQISYLEANPNVDILGGCSLIIDELGTIKGKGIVPVEAHNIKKLIWSCPLIHPSVMFNKKKIIAIGSYKANVAHRQEDYELWIRAVNHKLTISNLADVLIRYRVPNNQPPKNNFHVAFQRFVIGFPAVWKYDLRAVSLLAICFPLVRLLLPERVVTFITHKYDPRK